MIKSIFLVFTFFALASIASAGWFTEMSHEYSGASSTQIADGIKAVLYCFTYLGWKTLEEFLTSTKETNSRLILTPRVIPIERWNQFPQTLLRKSSKSSKWKTQDVMLTLMEMSREMNSNVWTMLGKATFPNDLDKNQKLFQPFFLISFFFPQPSHLSFFPTEFTVDIGQKIDKSGTVELER